MKSGFTPLWSEDTISRMFDQFKDETEEKLIIILQRAGEEFVKLAREGGVYIDHTGNLRSSVGYVIVRDGDIVDYNFERSAKGSGGGEGVSKGRSVAEAIALSHRNGLVLIGVAGMEYALSVESIEGKDVISSATEMTELWLQSFGAKLLKRL